MESPGCTLRGGFPLPIGIISAAVAIRYKPACCGFSPSMILEYLSAEMYMRERTLPLADVSLQQLKRSTITSTCQLHYFCAFCSSLVVDIEIYNMNTS